MKLEQHFGNLMNFCFWTLHIYYKNWRYWIEQNLYMMNKHFWLKSHSESRCFFFAPLSPPRPLIKFRSIHFLRATHAGRVWWARQERARPNLHHKDSTRSVNKLSIPRGNTEMPFWLIYYTYIYIYITPSGYNFFPLHKKFINFDKRMGNNIIGFTKSKWECFVLLSLMVDLWGGYVIRMSDVMWYGLNTSIS